MSLLNGDFLATSALWKVVKVVNEMTTDDDGNENVTESNYV